MEGLVEVDQAEHGHLAEGEARAMVAAREAAAAARSHCAPPVSVRAAAHAAALPDSEKPIQASRNGIDRLPLISARHLMSCAHAGCDLDDVLRCSRCRSVGYCSKGHQKADWRGHKSFCGKEEDGKENEADAAESTIVDVEEVLLRRGNRKVANHDLEGALADYTRVVDMFENDANTLDDGSLAISRAVVARAMSRRASVQNLQGNWNEAAVSALGALDRTPTLESAHLAYAAALEGMGPGSHMRCSALWEGQRQCPESTRLYECYHKCPWAHKLLVGKQQIVRRGGVRVVDGEEEGEAGGAGEPEEPEEPEKPKMRTGT